LLKTRLTGLQHSTAIMVHRSYYGHDNDAAGH